ncbi:MAG: FAD-binding oxidoreductase [Pseudomonadota bacterium]
MTDKPHYTILGAGIVGASCALALRKAGFGVTLIDRDTPGAGASIGNAGLIQTGTPLPVAVPGLARQLPKLLTNPKSPLSIKWRYLPRLAPFLWKLFRASKAREVERISKAMQAILDLSGPAYRAIAKEAGAQELLGSRGVLMVFPDEESFKAASFEFDLYERRGVAFDEVGEDQIRQMEPSIARNYRWGYHLYECFFTVSPQKLTEAIADRAVALGAEFVTDEVQDIEMGPDSVAALVCASGRRPVDRMVLAAGVFSKPFAKQLGVTVPMEAARGYHLNLPDPGIRLNGPVVDGKQHFGVTPMSEGIRLAGTIEFAKLEAEPNMARADMLLPLTKNMLPELGGSIGRQWMGNRPLTPDSLPVLGTAPKAGNVILAYGHGQLGLTMGPATGDIVVALAEGRSPGIDMTPYRPDRF